MNIFKKIRYWFHGTKVGLNLRVDELMRNVRDLEEAIEISEQNLWKERKFKEDYRSRLTKYYDECIELRKKAKKYHKLLRKCDDFKGFFGRNCKKFTLDLVGRGGVRKVQCIKKKKLKD